MAFSRIVRPFQTPNTAPPRLRTGRTDTSEPATVVLKLGEGTQGTVVNISYSISIQRYMTKQQRELEDEAEG